MIAVVLANDWTAVTLPAAPSTNPSANPSASVSVSPSPVPALTSGPVPASSLITSAPATAELTVYPTAAAHPDFVTGAIFLVIFVILLTVAYAVRVLRRRRHRWD